MPLEMPAVGGMTGGPGVNELLIIDPSLFTGSFVICRNVGTVLADGTTKLFGKICAPFIVYEFFCVEYERLP